MELRILRYFQTVVTERNITRAAKVLHVSQPTISRQLHELEDELGVSLFKRGSRQIELSEDGEYFYHQVTQILDLTDKTVQNIQMGKQVTGSVTIGGAEAKAFLLLAQSVTTFHRQYPLVSFRIDSAIVDVVADQLIAGVLDLGLILGEPDDSRLDFIALPGASRWGILVPNSALIAQRETVSLADLASMDLIISSRSKIQSVINAWFGDSLQDIHVVATYNLLYNASLLVAAGLGYALCVDGIINTNQSQFKFIPLTPEKLIQPSLVWVKDRPMSPAMKLLLKQIKNDLGSDSRT